MEYLGFVCFLLHFFDSLVSCITDGASKLIFSKCRCFVHEHTKNSIKIALDLNAFSVFFVNNENFVLFIVVEPSVFRLLFEDMILEKQQKAPSYL